MNGLQIGSLVLAAMAAALFLCPVWCGAVRLYRGEKTKVEKQKSASGRAALCAGLLCFAACASGAAFFAWRGAVRQPGADLEQALAAIFPSSIDADHYLKLAQYGYAAADNFPDQHLMIVFFPLFPLLVRAVHLLTGWGWYTAGTLIQPVLFGMAGGWLFALVSRRFGMKTAAWTLVYLIALPASFFFAAPMTESLYLLLLVWAFCALEAGRPAMFALCGCAAALARSTGGLLAGVAGVAFLQALRAGQKKDACRWLAAAAGPCAGTGLYLLLNRAVYGNWMQFAVYQKEHWNNSLGFFGNTVRYLFAYMLGWWQDNRAAAVYIFLAGLLCIFLQLFVFAWQRNTLPLPWLAYSLATVAVMDGATWLISAPRYMASLPFVPLCLALGLKKTWQRILCAAVLLLAAALYLREYLAGGPIY
jgi:hypothetical protein